VTSTPRNLAVPPSHALFEPDPHHAAKAVVTEKTSVTAAPSAVTQFPIGPRSDSILQRQQCNPADDHIVTGPLVTQLPTVACDPTPATLQDVRAVPGAPQTIRGVTENAFTTDQITFQESRGSRCNARVSPAAMTVNRSIYTKEGTFPDGTERTPSGRPCPAGQNIQKRMHVTADGARKLKQGEKEHCDDAKLAFALSWGKFNQASKDLEGNYRAAGIHATGAETICDKELAKRFFDRTGVEWAKRKDVADCLLALSASRDGPPNNWHDVVATNAFYERDCSAITYEITAASLPKSGHNVILPPTSSRDGEKNRLRRGAGNEQPALD
jgi:hypothetical protein